MEENLGKYQGDWIIADISSNEIISGTNPDFGKITQTHSHRAKIYEILSILYFNFVMFTFTSKVKCYCDNL